MAAAPWPVKRRDSVTVFGPDEVDRYARQLVLREIGGPGQRALADARVLIAGAGGLGSPAALYLAAAGVGHLVLADADSVSLSNLQRQVLFDTADSGALKVERAAARLRGLNPHVAVKPLAITLDVGNLPRLVAAADLVLDGTDTFPARFAINAACVAAKTPLVSGAIGRWSGQVGVFASRPCYRCWVPEAPPEAETCAAVGVVGALAGVVGSLMALEAIKLITRAGEPLLGRLTVFDGLAGEWRTVRVAADPSCHVCGEERRVSECAT